MGSSGYDHQQVTGGAGDRFSSASAARTEYLSGHRTVYLRAVSVRTVRGAAKHHHLQDDRKPGPWGRARSSFVAFRDAAFEAEVESPSNEPDQVALQQAIGEGVYGLRARKASNSTSAVLKTLSAAQRLLQLRA